MRTHCKYKDATCNFDNYLPTSIVRFKLALTPRKCKFAALVLRYGEFVCCLVTGDGSSGSLHPHRLSLH